MQCREKADVYLVIEIRRKINSVVPDKRATRALISDAQLRIGGPIRRDVDGDGKVQAAFVEASHVDNR
jgi:hypothetical protein